MSPLSSGLKNKQENGTGVNAGLFLELDDRGAFSVVTALYLRRRNSWMKQFYMTHHIVQYYNAKVEYRLKFKVVGRTVPRNNSSRSLFIFISALHVSALAGHLQAEYTIIFGKLFHYNGSVVLCYKSYFVYVSVNTAVVYLICGNVKNLKC
jgi:hypothetical protein